MLPLGIFSSKTFSATNVRDVTFAQDLAVEFEHQGTLRRAELTSEALIAKVVPRYRTLEKYVAGSTMLLSHRAARMLGLSEHISATGVAQHLRECQCRWRFTVDEPNRAARPAGRR